MADSHVDALRARYEGVSKDSLDSVFDGVDPDFELKTVSRVPNAGTYRGAAAATQFFKDLVEPFEEVSYDVQKAFARGEQVVLFLGVHFKPRGSNALVENQIGALWTMRDGRPVRCEMFATRELALDAAGMTAEDEVRD
jgi:ketosteroid isomerase-like protein